MRVYRRADITVPKQHLYGLDIVSIFLPADAWRKNGVINDMSPALLSRRCEQPLARLFVALIREDDAGASRQLPDRCSGGELEKPTAMAILDPRSGICAPARWAT